jgi:hypothetical protein
MALIADTRIRAKAKFDSTHTEHTYEIHLIDSEFNSALQTPEELKLDRDGFTLEHGHGDDMKHVLGSTFSMGIMVTDSATEDLAEDIMGLQEDRFGIRLYEDNELMWFGMIYQDGVQIDLQHQPYVFRVTAYDGLGKLKDLAPGAPWEVADNPLNIASVIVKMLRELDPLDLSRGDDFVVSAVDLRSDQHRAYDVEFDTLAETTALNFNPLFYKKYQDYGFPFEGRKWSEAMQRIMFAFHSQIRLMNGSYEIVPFEKQMQSGSSQVREFSTSYFHLDSDTSDPRDLSGVTFSTRNFGSGWTNDKTSGMSVGFEQAAERVMITEELGQAVVNRPADLASNSDTANFTTRANGFLDLQFSPGVFPVENQLSIAKDCWIELRAYVTTIYNSQTYYYGPFRETAAGSDFGKIIDPMDAWSTTERWRTMGATNYFALLKAGTPPYPDFSQYGSFGSLSANELAIVHWDPNGPQRDIIQEFFTGSGNPLGIYGMQHPSGSQATVTVQFKCVALEKNDNTITSDVDTDTITLTQAQLISAGLGHEKQGCTVDSLSGARASTFVHSIDSGQTGLSVLVKDIGNLMLNDKRGGAPTELRAYDGTDWDNGTEYWTDGTGTSDTPLITYLLRKHAQVYQKPVRRPDVGFIDSITLNGRNVSAGSPFPIGTSSSLVQYIVAKSKFTGRDGLVEQTWLEYDATPVTNDPTVDRPQDRTSITDDPTWVQPGDRDPDDPGVLYGGLSVEEGG